MSAPENPPAFPTLGNVGYNSDWQVEHGMTLRDHFAGQALPTTIAYMMEAVCGRDEPDVGFMAACARLSYQMADAMLLERGNLGIAPVQSFGEGRVGA